MKQNTAYNIYIYNIKQLKYKKNIIENDERAKQNEKQQHEGYICNLRTYKGIYVKEHLIVPL